MYFFAKSFIMKARCVGVLATPPILKKLAEGEGFGHRFSLASATVDPGSAPSCLRLSHPTYFNYKICPSQKCWPNSMAEGEGFEPSGDLRHAWFSRPARYDHFGIPP